MRGGREAGNKTSSLKSISLTNFLQVTFQRSCMILLEKRTSAMPACAGVGVIQVLTQNGEVLSSKSFLPSHHPAGMLPAPAGMLST